MKDLRSVPLLLPLLLAPLPAQVVGGEWRTLWQADGRSGDVRLGWSVSDAGDVDGDGVGDWIVGAPLADPGGRTDAGSAFVHSGATGQLIRQFDGKTPLGELGASVDGAGDVDGDGFADLAVGAPWTAPGGIQGAGAALVFSGATGSLIWRFDGQAAGAGLGWSVSATGDVDGDGHDDLIVGAPLASPRGVAAAGSVFLLSGKTGSPILWIDGRAPHGQLGKSVSRAGDLDQDGIEDLLVAEPSVGGHLFSGASGILLRTFPGTHCVSVSDAGDVDRDGVPDLVLGLDRTSEVYSGATGARLWTLQGGVCVSSAGDVDGDGHGDLLVGEPPSVLNLHVGFAHVYSGASGSRLAKFEGLAFSDAFGASVSGGGDMDGDGLDEVLVGSPGAAPGGWSNAGSAFVYSLDPFLHPSDHELSAGSGTSVLLDLDFPSTEAGAAYLVLASGTGTGPVTVGGLDLPLTRDRVFDRILRGWNPPILQAGRGLLDPSGDGRATLSGHPNLAPAIGQTVHLAAVSFDQATMTGRLSSIARSVTIVP